MAQNPSNSSNLKQLALKGLKSTAVAYFIEYLKSNWSTADWIAFEHDVYEPFESPECSPINALDAVVGQQQIPQRCQTSKSGRRQPCQPVVAQIKPCQTAQSTKGAILDLCYCIARQIQVDKGAKSLESASVDAGKLVVAEVQDF